MSDTSPQSAIKPETVTIMLLAESDEVMPGKAMQGLASDPSVRILRARTVKEAEAYRNHRVDLLLFDPAAVGPGSHQDILCTVTAIYEQYARPGMIAISRTAAPKDCVEYLRLGVTDVLGATDFHNGMAESMLLKRIEETLEMREAFLSLVGMNEKLEQQRSILEKEKLKTEKRNRELAAIAELTSALASELDCDRVMANIIGHVTRFFSVPHATVSLKQKRKGIDEILVYQSGGEDGKRVENVALAVVKADEEWMREAYAEGRQVFLEEEEYPRILVFENHKGPTGIFPMVHRGTVTGSINLGFNSGTEIDEDIRRLMAVFADTAAISLNNANLHAEMRAIAITDQLTGAFNRRYILERAEAEISDAGRHGDNLAVMILDIDHFKCMNDTNGHAAGDAALRNLAGILKRNMRGVDTVARYGGEEFLVLLPRTNLPNALIAAEKIRHAVERAEFEGGSRMPTGRLTVSIGVATYPDAGRSIDEVVARADKALYEAKTNGRNRIYSWRPPTLL